MYISTSKFFKDNKIARILRANAICSLKKFQVSQFVVIDYLNLLLWQNAETTTGFTLDNVILLMCRACNLSD